MGTLGQRLQWGLLCAVLCVGLTACGAGGEAEPGADEGAAATAEQAEAAAAARRAAFEWPQGPRPTVRIEVADMDTIEIELYPQLAPKTVANFLELAEKGFYDGTTFHRVIPGFMVQGGDPLTREDNDPANDGLGGPGYTIDDEFTDAPHIRGTVSMSNDGREDSGGSQFFIIQKDAYHLDGKHSLFGRVVTGMDVVDQITDVERDAVGRWGPPNRPISNVIVEQMVVTQGASDGDGAAVAGDSPTGDAGAAVQGEAGGAAEDGAAAASDSARENDRSGMAAR